MAIFRRCPTCGNLYQKRNCPTCAKKFDKKRREENEALSIYGKNRWKQCRKNIRIRYADYDIWLLGIGELRKIEGRVIVHHIMERDDRPDLIYNLDNLITVSTASHEEIHEAYTVNRTEALKRIVKGLSEFRRLFDGS